MLRCPRLELWWGGEGGSQKCRWTVSKPRWPRTVALKCEYAVHTRGLQEYLFWNSVCDFGMVHGKRSRMSSARGLVQAYFPASKRQAYISACFSNNNSTKHIGKSGSSSGTRGSWSLAERTFNVYWLQKSKWRVPPVSLGCQISRTVLELRVSKHARECPSRTYFPCRQSG